MRGRDMEKDRIAEASETAERVKRGAVPLSFSLIPLHPRRPAATAPTEEDIFLLGPKASVRAGDTQVTAAFPDPQCI